MRSIRELLEVSKEDLPDIYCDMDGVLCNFMKAADKAVGGSFVTTDSDERWNKINQTKNFWANLEWMPGAKRLYQKIIRYNPYINTDFKRRNILLVKRSQKQQYAKTGGKPNVLIDDYDKNIKEWESKGGIGIHHTSVGKSIGELNRLGFK